MDRDYKKKFFTLNRFFCLPLIIFLVSHFYNSLYFPLIDYDIYRRIKALRELELILSFREKDFDYSKIVCGYRIVIFGEDHGNNFLRLSNDSPKDELIRQLACLKSSGFNYLGLEMFPYGKQNLLDSYFESQGEEEAVLEKEVLKVLEDFWGWAPKKYLELIRTAKQVGIRIIGLHDGGDETRESFMSKIVIEVLQKSPENKIIVFVGNAHLFNMGEYLKEFSPLKIALLGGGNYDNRIYKPTILEKIAREGGIEKERFLISAEKLISIFGYNPIFGADIYIHLPTSFLSSF